MWCFIRRCRTRCVEALPLAAPSCLSRRRISRKCASFSRCCPCSTCVQLLRLHGSTLPGATGERTAHASTQLITVVRQAQVVSPDAAVSCCGLASCLVNCCQGSHDLGSILELPGAFHGGVRSMRACSDMRLHAGRLGVAVAPAECCRRLCREQRAVQRARGRASCNDRRVALRGAGAPRTGIFQLSALTRCAPHQAGFVHAKTEGLDDAGLLPFKFLLSARSSVPGFALQHVVHGFSRLRLGRPPRLLAVDTTPQVYVHARAP